MVSKMIKLTQTPKLRVTKIKEFYTRWNTDYNNIEVGSAQN